MRQQGLNPGCKVVHLYVQILQLRHGLLRVPVRFVGEGLGVVGCCLYGEDSSHNALKVLLDSVPNCLHRFFEATCGLTEFLDEDRFFALQEHRE